MSTMFASAMALLCVLGPSIVPATDARTLHMAPPDAFISVAGFIYEADGVTPVSDCIVNVTNKNTGAWGLTTSGPTGYYYFYTEELGYPPPGPDDVINVTATKGSQIGWNETVVGRAFIILWIDVVMSASEQVYSLDLVQGWNFVSIPLVIRGYRASTLGLLFGDVVVGWNPALGRSDQVYIVGISPQIYDFDILPDTGYEIYSSSSRKLNLIGTAPAGVQTKEVTVPERGGCIALGLLGFNSTRRASDVPGMYSVPGGVSAVIAFDAVTKKYVCYYPAVPFSDFSLTVGQGLWVWCEASGVLSYNA